MDPPHNMSTFSPTCVCANMHAQACARNTCTHDSKLSSLNIEAKRHFQIKHSLTIITPISYIGNPGLKCKPQCGYPD